MEFFVYLIKVNIALALFYGVYRLFFQQDTFFQWKRFALLTIIFISFTYPAIDISRPIVENHQLRNILETISIPSYTLQELVISGNAVGAVNYYPQILLIFYLLITGFLLLRVLFRTITIFYNLSRTTKRIINGYTVYESPGLKTPFSFFRYIVLDSSLYSESELQEILMHEATHAEQMHSIDTLITELLCAICWFNPFVWLFRTEIRMNLEFLADKSVLSSGYGAEHYQLHLLSLSYNKAAVTITNNFNVSLLKKRIFMMNKKQTPNRSILKYALIIPVIAILLLINCTSNKKEQKDNVTNIDPPKTEMKVDQQIKTDEANTDQQNAVVGTTDETKPVIHSQVEEMPKFPGGDAALMKWLSDSIAYPPSAQEKGIQGTVNLRFIVKPDGSVGDVELIKGLDPECDKAAISAVKKLPKFVPGKQNGVPVHVYFNMPVRFRLQQS